MKIFINEFRLNITKNVLIRDKPPRLYIKVFSKALRLEVMRQKMVRERRK